MLSVRQRSTVINTVLTRLAGEFLEPGQPGADESIDRHMREVISDRNFINDYVVSDYASLRDAIVTNLSSIASRTPAVAEAPTSERDARGRFRRRVATPVAPEATPASFNPEVAPPAPSVTHGMPTIAPDEASEVTSREFDDEGNLVKVETYLPRINLKVVNNFTYVIKEVEKIVEVEKVVYKDPPPDTSAFSPPTAKSRFGARHLTENEAYTFVTETNEEITNMFAEDISAFLITTRDFAAATTAVSRHLNSNRCLSLAADMIDDVTEMEKRFEHLKECYTWIWHKVRRG